MSSKRKRAATLASKDQTGTKIELTQPSSGDASGEEDALESVLQAPRNGLTDGGGGGGGGGDATADSSDSLLLTAKTKKASKRSRSSNANVESGSSASESGNAGDDDGGSDLDDGEQAATLKMEAPPQAGLVHPVGYRTNPPPAGRPVRVYADGVFDLFHLGHMRQLEQAKKAFPEVYLLVGVTGDKETHRRKGLTVLSGKERAESIRHCRWVDEVVEDCPWVLSLDFVEEHKIDYVAHDDIPYGGDEGDDIYAPIKAAGKFLVTQRTEGVSTTGIITKIVRDYESYISRQLKRGTSRRELNVSWLKKNEIDVKRHLAELRDDIRTNWTTTGQEIGKDLRQFWQSSRPASPGLLSPTEQKAEDEANSLNLKTSPSGKTASGRASDDRYLHIPTNLGANWSSDFATGYTLGLIGGVKSWMSRTRRNLNESDGHELGANSPYSSGGERNSEAEPSASSSLTKLPRKISSE